MPMPMPMPVPIPAHCVKVLAKYYLAWQNADDKKVRYTNRDQDAKKVSARNFIVAPFNGKM